MLIALVVILPVAIFAWIYLAPTLDRIFGAIWSENAPRRESVRRRLIELHRSGVGEHAALAMVAREAHLTEAQVMKALDLLSPSDVAVMTAGQRTWFQQFVELLEGRRFG